MDQNSCEQIKPMIWFDMNKQLGGICKFKLDFLSKVIEETDIEMKEYGFFYGNISQDQSKHEIFKRQTGVLRTNCMDCTDRTNIVQTVFSRYLLLMILYNFGLVSHKPTGSAFEDLPENLENIFCEIWEMHGNVLGNLYAGTGS